MKYLLASIALLFASCATLTPTQGALLVDAISLAKITGSAAAGVYGGPAAGAAASAILNGFGTVAQGYVNSKIPKSVVVATPGVDQVGQVLSNVISTKGTVTQADVNTIYDAAAIAAKSVTPPQ